MPVLLICVSECRNEETGDRRRADTAPSLGFVQNLSVSDLSKQDLFPPHPPFGKDGMTWSDFLANVSNFMKTPFG
jgi:hypothetical protein